MGAIVKLSSLGDVIHSTIVLPLLAEKGERLTFFVDQSFSEILEGNRWVQEVVPVPLREIKKERNLRQLLGTIRELGHYSFEKVVDLQGLIKSGVLSWIISKKGGKRIGGTPSRERVAELFYTRKVPVNPNWVATERYMGIAGVYNREFLIEHPPLLQFEQRNFPELSKNRPNVAFVIGSTWECRKLPVESWVQIGKGLKGANLIIPYFGEEEKEYGAQILEKVGEGHLVQYRLGELKSLLSQVDLIIGHDTGPVFIGWANNIPNLILYTCTYRNKILENRYCRSVEVQRGQVDRRLFNSHLIDPRIVLKELEKLL
ncbi:MAG: glycosyltransferase family 9 protein [Campylobacterales bacterium]